MSQNNYDGILQKAIGSGFNSKSTSNEVIQGIDLKGKTAIITGAYTGIGLETAKTLIKAGVNVIAPARNLEKAKISLKDLKNVEVEYMDLMDSDSIDDFATKFLSTNRTLDILINNAGIMWVPLRRDKHANESQLSTNHLGHFRLTARLWSALKKSKSARIVTVSSFGHQMSPFVFEDPNFINRDYETLQGYGQSKTANILFTVELAKRAKNTNISSFVVHPGSVNDTELGREAPIEMFIQMGSHDSNGLIKPEVVSKLKTISQGAATTVWCASSPMLDNISGVYCENVDIAQIDNGEIEHKFDEPDTLFGVRPYALNEDIAKKLWKLSEELTGIVFSAN